MAKLISDHDVQIKSRMDELELQMQQLRRGQEHLQGVQGKQREQTSSLSRALEIAEAAPAEAMAMQKEDAFDREPSKTILKINAESLVLRSAVAVTLRPWLERAEIPVDQI